MTAPAPLPAHLVTEAVTRSLLEDLGLSGDITSIACIPAQKRARLAIVSRQEGVIAGLQLAVEAFRQMDPEIRVTLHKQDGDAMMPKDVVLTAEGNARAILSAERTALNFCGRLSGIATLTRQYIRAVEGTAARIVDTRKTTPGLRVFEKHAVRCGGAKNHRFGLFDAILIKDNHIGVAGSIAAALQAAKAASGHLVKIEIEVDSLAQLEEVIAEGADTVLLDNMDAATLAQAVARVKAARPTMLTEASGGVNLSTVAGIAKAGVDLISVGALTHSAPVLDLGLDIAVQ